MHAPLQTPTTNHDRPRRRSALLGAAALAAAAALGLSACNTMEGAGQDLQAAGEGLEREAEEAR